MADGLFQLFLALPPLGAVVAALAIVLVEAVGRRSTAWIVDGLALLGLGASAWLQLAALGYGAGATVARGTGGALVRQDPLAAYGGLLVLFAAAFTVLVGGSTVARRGLRRAEYTVVLLLAAAGMQLLCAATDLLIVFLAVEAFSIGLYVLCAFRAGDLDGYEAALKYFVLGAIAAGFLLYGTALSYAAAGTTALDGIAAALGAGDGAARSTAWAGLALLVVGLGFKLAIVPFHHWAPDVYQGAPTPVTGFMAAATKTAALVALVRVLWSAFGSAAPSWQPAMAVLAVATMVVGNLAALVQDDLKRMLAFSAVAHAGYLLVAVVAAPTGGVAAAMYYLLAYGLAKLGAFGVLALLGASAPGASDDGAAPAGLSSLAGLGTTQPWLAAAMTVCLVSLVGLPPAIGFLGKWMIFQAAVDGGWTWLAVVLVLNSAVSAFYYLRPLGWMYMVEAPGDRPVEVGTGAALALTVAVLGIVTALFSGGLAGAARAADGFDQRPPDAAPADPAAPDGPPPTAGPGLIPTAAAPIAPGGTAP